MAGQLGQGPGWPAPAARSRGVSRGPQAGVKIDWSWALGRSSHEVTELGRWIKRIQLGCFGVRDVTMSSNGRGDRCDSVGHGDSVPTGNTTTGAHRPGFIGRGKGEPGQKKGLDGRKDADFSAFGNGVCKTKGKRNCTWSCTLVSYLPWDTG